MGKVSNTSFLPRLMATHNIRVPKIVESIRWVSLVYRLSERDLDGKNEVHIRPGSRKDLQFFATLGGMSDSMNFVLNQDIKFWDNYGFRCLYVGCLEDYSHPVCMQFWIDESDNHRFDSMDYGDMYQKLNSDTIHAEGGYVRKDLRGKGIFRKFRTASHRMLFLKGIKVVRSHIAANKRQILSLKVAAAVGFIPDHWISRIRIQLPFFTSIAFVHHTIRDTDRGKFPLSFFHQGSSS